MPPHPVSIAVVARPPSNRRQKRRRMFRPFRRILPAPNTGRNKNAKTTGGLLCLVDGAKFEAVPAAVWTVMVTICAPAPARQGPVGDQLRVAGCGRSRHRGDDRVLACRRRYCRSRREALGEDISVLLPRHRSSQDWVTVPHHSERGPVQLQSFGVWVSHGQAGSNPNGR